MAGDVVFTTVVDHWGYMFETPLHTGAQHPDLLWILLPSLLSFAAGLGLGSISERLHGWVAPERQSSET